MTATASHSAPARDRCPICDETQREQLIVKDGWPIARCATCGMVFVDAVPGRELLEAVYGRGYYEGEVFEDYLGEREVRLASARARAAEIAAAAPGGRLLDVGCAAGFFLHAASAHYEVEGVELSAFAAQQAREQFGLRVHTGEIFDAPLADAAFDVVTMWDTVEHLAEPRAVLAEVARVLRPGGLLVLSTGDVRGPLARRDLAGWDLMTPPAHLLFFSPATLERLLNDVGCEVGRIFYDGRISSRPALDGRAAHLLASILGVGNVMTVHARRVDAPRRRHRVARLPDPRGLVRR